MKKLFVILTAVVFSTVTVFAQATKTETKETKKDAKESKMETKADNTHCYAMINGKMSHCTKTAGDPMTKDVTLKNGTMVSTKGEVTMKDGKKMMLKEGQCIDMEGKVGDFKTHDAMGDKKMDDKKMEEKKK